MFYCISVNIYFISSNIFMVVVLVNYDKPGQESSIWHTKLPYNKGFMFLSYTNLEVNALFSSQVLLGEI